MAEGSRKSRDPFVTDPSSRAMAGDRLRRTRTQQGLSIRQIAQLAGISKTSVVQVELGRSTRRSTYLKVAQVLGLHLEKLLQPAPDESLPYAVHRNSDDIWYDLAKFDEGPLPPDADLASLSQDGVIPLNILASRLERGRIKPTILELYAASPARSHAGEEHVFVLSGSALVTVGESVLNLSEGESITFWSAEPHAYAPAPGTDLPVRLLSVRVDA